MATCWAICESIIGSLWITLVVWKPVSLTIWGNLHLRWPSKEDGHLALLQCVDTYDATITTPAIATRSSNCHETAPPKRTKRPVGIRAHSWWVSEHRIRYNQASAEQVQCGKDVKKVEEMFGWLGLASEPWASVVFLSILGIQSEPTRTHADTYTLIIHLYLPK